MVPYHYLYPDGYYNSPDNIQYQNENHPKRFKYDYSYENMMFPAGFEDMQNQYIYNQQGNQALGVQYDQCSTISTSSSIVSSMAGYPFSLSPDFTGQVSPAAFPNYSHPHVDPPSLLYFEANNQAPNIVLKRERDDDVDLPQSSLNTPEPEIQSTRTRVASDSGNSTVPSETNGVEPVYMDDWFHRSVDPDVNANLAEILSRIQIKSSLRKDEYMSMRKAELPTEMEYNPNKSRMRRTNLTEAEAAEREKNNLASRKSRFKKKIAIQVTNMSMEFDRIEIAEMQEMENWLLDVIDDLEKECLNSGVAPEEVLLLRQQCGINSDQPEQLYTAGTSSN